MGKSFLVGDGYIYISNNDKQLDSVLYIWCPEIDVCLPGDLVEIKLF